MINNSGRMRDLITIQYPAATLNDYREPVTTWRNFASVWANCMIGTGREFWGAKKLNAELSGIVQIRQLPGTNERMRLVIDANPEDYEPLYTAIYGLALYQDSAQAFRVPGDLVAYLPTGKHIQIFYSEASQVLTITGAVYDDVNAWTVVTADQNVPAAIDTLRVVDLFQLVAPPIRIANGAIYELHVKGVT